MANKDFKVKNGIDIQSPLPVSMGGTGQTSTTNTLNSLLPSQAGNTNKVLQTDGTNTTWYSVPAAYTRGGMASRPASPTAGDLFFNTDKKAFEVWTGDAWVSVAVNGAVPLAPTIGTATVSGLTASVPFTGPTDFGDAAITTYTATSTPGSITASNASSPISVSGLSANTSYTFTVTATNSYGVSNASSASNSITTANVPGAPTSVSAADPGTDGYATVSWTAPASNGGSAITDYTVQYSSNSGSTWTTFSDGTSTSTSATVTGLTIGTAYIFRVAAVNIIGTGSYSTASSSFTPPTHITGMYEPIAFYSQPTYTPVSGTITGGVTFGNIPQTYRHLQIRMNATCGPNYQDSDIVMQFNSDSGSGAPSNYWKHRVYGSGSSIGQDAGSMNGMQIARGGGATNILGPAIIDILDYTNTTRNKVVRSLFGQDSNGTGYIMLSSGVWLNTGAINSITLNGANYTGFGTNTSIALYGIKGD